MRPQQQLRLLLALQRLDPSSPQTAAQSSGAAAWASRTDDRGTGVSDSSQASESGSARTPSPTEREQDDDPTPTPHANQPGSHVSALPFPSLDEAPPATAVVRQAPPGTAVIRQALAPDPVCVWGGRSVCLYLCCYLCHLLAQSLFCIFSDAQPTAVRVRPGTPPREHVEAPDIDRGKTAVVDRPSFSRGRAPPTARVAKVLVRASVSLETRNY
jgi:hypothetical protein